MAGWYNLPVPTPFYHLRLAEDMLAHPGLTVELKQFLHHFSCAFLFGNTAPDVQVISGQLRQQTHFFNLPIQAGDRPAWEELLSEYPHLADTNRYPPDRTAFLAGYLCHLQADWMWVKDLFAPAFGPGATWGTFPKRLYLHNVLRAYLDVRILPELPPGMDNCLGKVQPDGWLPFVADHYLIEWREVLVPQLKPGAATQTVEVLSSRQGISTTEFHAIVESENRMQREIFTHVSLQKVQEYHQRVLDENCHLLSEYLGSLGLDAISQSMGVLRGTGS